QRWLEFAREMQLRARRRTRAQMVQLLLEKSQINWRLGEVQRVRNHLNLHQPNIRIEPRCHSARFIERSSRLAESRERHHKIEFGGVQVAGQFWSNREGA